MSDPLERTPPAIHPQTTALLNLLLFGVGYVYLGQWQKFLAQLALGFLLAALTGAYGGVTIALAALTAIVSAFDGYAQSLHVLAGFPIGPWTFFGKHK